MDKKTNCLNDNFASISKTNDEIVSCLLLKNLQKASTTSIVLKTRLIPRKNALKPSKASGDGGISQRKNKRVS